MEKHGHVQWIQDAGWVGRKTYQLWRALWTAIALIGPVGAGAEAAGFGERGGKVELVVTRSLGAILEPGSARVVGWVATLVAGAAFVAWLVRKRRNQARKAGLPGATTQEMVRALEANGADLPRPIPSPSDQLDLSLLRYLADGKPGGLAEELDRFLQVLTAAEARLQAAADSGIPRELGDAAHALLSQGRMLDHQGVIAAARRLETATVDGRTGGTPGLIRALFEETARLRKILGEVRNASPSR